jgi:hypothetical protein
MIIDNRTLFAADFDLDQETGTYLFTNQIDIGVAGRDIGNGQPVYLICVVTETFTDGGDAATLNLRLRSDDTATIHATTSSGHFESGTMLKAALVAGTTFVYPITKGNAEFERYIGLQAVVGTAGFDAGMITAFLSLDPTGWKAYADAAN